ncbi:MAG: hypothetical protein CVT95_09455 [Bacteroidetes bacterium HGW-Bacteroidetes-12]|nr:MAG: hypothetical protein CVT95_09455 [Bacteroidetes bacterium HGW-Bacteroidetes-12]
MKELTTHIIKALKQSLFFLLGVLNKRKKLVYFIVFFLLVTNVVVPQVMPLGQMMQSNNQTAQGQVQSLLNSPFVNNALREALSKTQSLAWIIATIIFGLSFGWGYITHSVKSLLKESSSGYFDKQGLFYGIFIFFLISIFPTVATTLESGIDYVNSITALSDNTKKVIQDNRSVERDVQKEALIAAANNSDDPKLQKAAIMEMDEQGISENDYQNPNAAAQPRGFDDLSIWEKILFNINPANWPSIFFYQLGSSLTAIIRFVIMMFTFYYVKILLILGPLALAFGISKRFDSLVIDWFGAVLHSGLVFTTLNILDYLYASYYNFRFGDVGGMNYNEHNLLSEIALNCTFIIMYLSAFKITKHFIWGKGLAASMVGKTIALGTAAVAGVVALGAAGAGGVGMAGASGAGKSAFVNALSTSQKAESSYRKADNED